MIDLVSYSQTLLNLIPLPWQEPQIQPGSSYTRKIIFLDDFRNLLWLWYIKKIKMIA